MAAKQTKADLTVAVLLTFEAQMLDMSPVDLFGMMSKEYLEIGLPQPLVRLGMNVKISYIGPSHKANPEASYIPSNTTGFQDLTAQAKVATDSTIDDPHVQPGQIDVLMIPGPPPAQQQPANTLAFVRSHAKHGTTILTVCSGCYVAAQAGILDGRAASGPRALVPSLRKTYQHVAWDDTRRYVKDAKRVKGSEGEIWTSGGICNGQEMVAAYIQEKYPGPLSKTVCAMADVGDKGELYDTPVAVDTAWFIGQIIRALLFGKRK